MSCVYRHLNDNCGLSGTCRLRPDSADAKVAPLYRNSGNRPTDPLATNYWTLAEWVDSPRFDDAPLIRRSKSGTEYCCGWENR